MLVFCVYDAYCTLCQVMCSRVRNASSEVKQKILALFESMFVLLSCLHIFIFVERC